MSSLRQVHSRKQIEILVFELQETLIFWERDVPKDDRREFLRRCARYFQRTHFAAVVEERAVQQQCGYPLCSKQVAAKRDDQGTHRILWSSKRKAYSIELRSDQQYCSAQCQRAADDFVAQLNDEPPFLRNFALLPSGVLIDDELISEEGGGDVKEVRTRLEGVHIAENSSASTAPERPKPVLLSQKVVERSENVKKRAESDAFKKVDSNSTLLLMNTDFNSDEESLGDDELMYFLETGTGLSEKYLKPYMATSMSDVAVSGASPVLFSAANQLMTGASGDVEMSSASGTGAPSHSSSHSARVLNARDGIFSQLKSNVAVDAHDLEAELSSFAKLCKALSIWITNRSREIVSRANEQNVHWGLERMSVSNEKPGEKYDSRLGGDKFALRLRLLQQPVQRYLSSLLDAMGYSDNRSDSVLERVERFMHSFSLERAPPTFAKKEWLMLSCVFLIALNIEPRDSLLHTLRTSFGTEMSQCDADNLLQIFAPAQ